jgi:hypothetical protein
MVSHPERTLSPIRKACCQASVMVIAPEPACRPEIIWYLPGSHLRIVSRTSRSASAMVHGRSILIVISRVCVRLTAATRSAWPPRVGDRAAPAPG